MVTAVKATRDLSQSSLLGLSALRLAILMAAIVYGFTEAIFSRLPDLVRSVARSRCMNLRAGAICHGKVSRRAGKNSRSRSRRRSLARL